MAFSASVADLLQFERWLDSLGDLDRAAMERAIAHKFGRGSSLGYDANDVDQARRLGYSAGFREGRIKGLAEGTRDPNARQN